MHRQFACTQMAHAATAWSREPAATRRKDEMTRAMKCAAERQSHTMAKHPSSFWLNQAASTRSVRHAEHHGCAHATSSSCRPICSALRDKQRGHLPGRCLSNSQRLRAPCSARAPSPDSGDPQGTRDSSRIGDFRPARNSGIRSLDHKCDGTYLVGSFRHFGLKLGKVEVKIKSL